MKLKILSYFTFETLLFQRHLIQKLRNKNKKIANIRAHLAIQLLLAPPQSCSSNLLSW